MSRLEQGDHAERKAALRQEVPYVAMVRPPETPLTVAGPRREFRVATYNIHRWTGLSGGRRWNPDLAAAVLAELDVDVIALQEVLRPFDTADPLLEIADDLGLHLTFVSTRVHRFGELGNAILSTWPMDSVFTIDLSVSRLERRSAAVAVFDSGEYSVAIASTHLALVDRTRQRQVQSLLDNDDFAGPSILLGDMNAWRRCPATRTLNEEFRSMHHNLNWPASFPAARPVLALDRVYARGARVTSLDAHDTPMARRASDHLPVVATVELDELSE
ncbi:MAG: endonuclease/exonuclease/phosphatase family protein [Rhodothermales bacterium]